MSNILILASETECSSHRIKKTNKQQQQRETNNNNNKKKQKTARVLKAVAGHVRNAHALLWLVVWTAGVWFGNAIVFFKKKNFFFRYKSPADMDFQYFFR